MNKKKAANTKQKVANRSEVIPERRILLINNFKIDLIA
jgi:hypothetical protein